MSTELISSVPIETASRRLLLSGGVQGLGVRPTIARLAGQLKLAGQVRNTMAGVEINIEGPAAKVRRFCEQLPGVLPGHPRVDQISDAPWGAFRDFRIEPSDVGEHLQTIVPVDLVVCEACLGETRSVGNRRYHFAFTSCVQCGPRYSIINAMPYDRSRTGMSDFTMCDLCLSEYQSPSDRRFHSQTNCCPQCGPRLWSTAAGDAETPPGDESLELSIAGLRAGKIVAVKGVGGYQLLCDATDDDAVAKLRRRKRRTAKPLAVMVASMKQAEELAELSWMERAALTSSAGPIVLARGRQSASLSRWINPGLRDLGLMLPTSPLHAILVDGVNRPLVVTSGNIEGEPIEYQTDSAQSRLSPVADRILHHDRPIVRPIDDSVVRKIADRIVTIRAARGIAPLPIDCGPPSSWLAVGGQQKVAVAVAAEGQCVLGPHLGDLGSIAMRDRFEQQTESIRQLYHVDNVPIARDAHPDYHSSRWTDSIASQTKVVGHHHGHVVSGMAEHGWLEQRVLGVAFDGTGLGRDGTIWGGEFLLATADGFRRVGHIRTFALLGGEVAMGQPWRVACVLLQSALGDASDVIVARLTNGRCSANFVRQLSENRSLSPLTSSAGRLFDGVAAIVLRTSESEYEGQPAMRLEAACDERELGSYSMPLRREADWCVDWRPMIRELVADDAKGTSAGVMAMRFHRGLASAVSSMAKRFSKFPVVLSGGVFQNRVLTELIADQLQGHSAPIGFPARVPPGDGGLAVGQLAIALTSNEE